MLHECPSGHLCNKAFYITLCGDYDSLLKIDPYLERSKYSALGPNCISLMHFLILGFEKLGTPPSTKVVDCAKFLLEQKGALKWEENSFKNPPKAYAEQVLQQIKNWEGFFTDYTLRVSYLNQIIQLLS